jgi:hypothetical protein
MVSSERSSRPSNHECGLADIAPRGTPPLGKGRSEPAKLATGGGEARSAQRMNRSSGSIQATNAPAGAHFVPHPQISLPRWRQRRPREVTPNPTSLREDRTSPFQGEEAAPA